MWPFSPKTLEERKNSAFRIHIEFGPKARIPREQRLGKAFSDVAPETIIAWIDEFEQVNSHIWFLAEKGGPEKHSSKGFSDAMLVPFPWLDRKSLTSSRSRAVYYAAHEGYDW
jgi:hypothetical protein